MHKGWKNNCKFNKLKFGKKNAKKIKTKQETFFKKRWVLFINNLNSSFLAIANMLRKKKKFMNEHHFG
jgi:hypothetical protein